MSKKYYIGRVTPTLETVGQFDEKHLFLVKESDLDKIRFHKFYPYCNGYEKLVCWGVDCPKEVELIEVWYNLYGYIYTDRTYNGCGAVDWSWDGPYVRSTYSKIERRELYNKEDIAELKKIFGEYVMKLAEEKGMVPVVPYRSSKKKKGA